jgi:hypothetical protein
MKKTPPRVIRLANRLRDGEVLRSRKVRVILKWFRAERRGTKVLSDIKTALASLGIETQPALDQAKIHDSVKFLLSSSSKSTNASAQQRQNILHVTTDEPTDKNARDGATPSDDHLEPEPDEEQASTKPDDRPVVSQGSDWTISVLRDKMDRGLLNLQPTFQREYVWKSRPELPSRLIESLLLEIPIPPIYFGKDADGSLEMIDGQQRLTTLVNFVSNKFPLRKLKSMASLNHKVFKDLTKQQQEKILDTPIRSIVIDAGNNTNLRYEVFERLNRGSMALNAL